MTSYLQNWKSYQPQILHQDCFYGYNDSRKAWETNAVMQRQDSALVLLFLISGKLQLLQTSVNILYCSIKEDSHQVSYEKYNILYNHVFKVCSLKYWF